MKRSVLIKAVALCGIAAIAFAASAQAQVTKDDAKCRATLNKSTNKMAATAGKAVVGCIKDTLKGKQSGVDCTDPTAADTKSKIGKARTKLTSSSSKCVALPQSYVTCPSPGTVGAVGSAAAATACLADVVEPAAGVGSVELFWKEILNVDFDAPALNDEATAKDVGKCINDIAKNANKLYATYGKVAGKVTQSADKASLSDTDYGVFTDKDTDAKSKVSKARGKLSAAIDKRCLSVSQDVISALGSCSQNVAELAGCIGDIATKNASGVNSVSFAMPGVCPTGVDITGAGSFVDVPSGRAASATILNSGWTGLGHDGHISEGFRGAVDLTCTDGTCSDCAVEASCREGNCRCDGTPGTTCDEPFGPDADDCGGADCILYFGPPLPLSAGGTPACVVNSIPQQLDGTANIGNGSSVTTVTTFADVYASGTGDFGVASPCPECQGDATPNDGTKGGTCSSGLQVGNACDTNFTNSVLGDTSYDCQPASGFSRLTLPITLSEQDKSHSFDVPSTLGIPVNVACNVCSNDGTLACSSDAECGGGTCDSKGAGTDSQPNSCGNSNLVCGADGVCADPSDVTKFCDGLLKESGDGVIACSDDAGCAALDTECPGGDCGNCTIEVRTACFPDPTVNTDGVPGQNGAILTAQFCTPPTGTGIDGAAGQPGLSDLTLDFGFLGLCADGVTEYELGGNNCPAP